LRYVLSRVAYQDKDERVVGRPDPLIVGPAPLLHEKGERSALPAARRVFRPPGQRGGVMWCRLWALNGRAPGA
jgi:hypothetical protein